MPLVRITASHDHSDETLAAAGDAVHRAMVATIDVPEQDRFQVISRAAPGAMIWDRSFLGVQRSDSQLFVELTFALGRDDDKKRALYAAINKNIVEATGMRPQDILICVTEVQRVNWSFGEGIAQYVPG